VPARSSSASRSIDLANQIRGALKILGPRVAGGAGRAVAVGVVRGLLAGEPSAGAVGGAAARGLARHP
jgi:hypothetical protein